MRVAAIAAVQSYMRSQEEERGSSISDKYTPGGSGWGHASLKEGIGAKPYTSPPSSKEKKAIWSQITTSLVAASLSMFMGSYAAFAQTMPQEKLSSFKQNAPELAPSFRPANLNLRQTRTNYVPAFAPAFQRQTRFKPVRPLMQPHAFMYEKTIKDDKESRQIQNPIFGSKKKTVFVKVGLLTGVSSFTFDTFDGAQVIDLSSKKVVARIEPEGSFLVSNFNKSGKNHIALTPKSAYDATRLVKIDSNIQKVSFRANPASLVPHITRAPAIKRGRRSRLRPGLSVPVLQGSLPREYLTGRSENDLSTLAGILIAPPEYATTDSNSLFSLNGRVYRGALLITPRTVKTKRGGSKIAFNAINVVDIEDYLFSVLPSEMPSKWPLEALKAQSIAARSYVMANLGKHRANGYDVRASVSDQAYTGVLKESDRTNQAVLETSGMIMKHDNKVVSAFFHSSGGGRTEVSQNVWSKELPYLKSVRDFDHSSPHHSWKKGFKRSTVEAKLGLPKDSLVAMFPIERSPSKRVKTLLVITDTKADLLKGTKVRSLLGLPGTNFNLNYENGSYVFAGQGFGHGLGLSQWGAKVLAEHGYNAGQILKYYYKDVTFSQIFEERAL